MLRLALAFAAGAASGALFVRWYIQTHPGSVFGGALADAVGANTPWGKIIKGVGGAVDEAIAQ